MATRGKSQQDKQPQRATVQIMDDSPDGPCTTVESSVDLYIVLDDQCSSVGTTPIGNRLTDARAESPKQKEHNYYKVLFESTVDGLFIVDAEMMRIVLANQTAAELYGFESADDMVGINPMKLVHPEDKDRVLRAIAEDIIRNDLRLIHRFRAVTTGGHEMWVRAVGTRTEFQGKLAGLISIRDVSDPLRAEEEKRSTQQRLAFESQIASMAELAAGLAHELNDPMATVLNYAQLLMSRRNVDETVKSGLEAIEKAAQRATSITDNLLQFSRRHKPDKTFVLIGDILEKAVAMRARELEARGIGIYVDTDPDLPLVRADFEQIKHVFMNIIENAEHAMIEAGRKGKLAIRTRLAGDMVQTTFADNGIGISEDNLGRVFDPFFTTRVTGKGAGLGLTVTYGLIEGHGGRIQVTSKPGKGTTCVVGLPVLSEDEPADVPQDATPARQA